jgi:hypothetical protein
MEWNVVGLGVRYVSEDCRSVPATLSHVTISNGARLAINTVRAINRFTQRIPVWLHEIITSSQARIAPIVPVAGFGGQVDKPQPPHSIRGPQPQPLHVSRLALNLVQITS